MMPPLAAAGRTIQPAWLNAMLITIRTRKEVNNLENQKAFFIEPSMLG
jgi:hypothetical protein